MPDEKDDLTLSDDMELSPEPSEDADGLSSDDAEAKDVSSKEKSPPEPAEAQEESDELVLESYIGDASPEPAETKPAKEEQTEEEELKFTDNLVSELEGWGGGKPTGQQKPEDLEEGLEEEEPTSIAHQELAPPPEALPKEGLSIDADLEPRVIFKGSLAQTGLMERVGQYFWAVDIGSHTIKVVGLKQKRKSAELIFLSLVEILPGHPLPEQESSYRAAVINALDMATSGIKQRQREAFVSSISSSSAVVRQVKYPVAVKDKLLSAIQWEVRKFIPYEPDDVIVDAQILSTGEKKMEVLLAAVPKDNLQYHQEILSESGLNAQIVDTDSMALTNALMLQVNLRPQETALLIDIGAKTTILNMFQREGMFFTRSLSIAGDKFTRNISSELEVNFTDAEAIKRGEIVEGQEVTPEKLKKILNPSYKRLYSEIHKSLIFYNKQTGVKDFHYLFLSGGGANLPGLQEFLSEKLGKNVALLSPVAGLEVDEKNISRDMVTRFGPQIGLAVGLAYRMKRS